MKHCKIQGLATAVPSQVISNESFDGLLGGERHAKRVLGMVGIQTRRWAPPGVTALDLCVAAAERLFADTGTSRGSVSGIVLVSQSGDFPAPATACLAQARLEIPRNCLAFDVNQGCAGFPYGLALATLIAA